MNKADCSRIKKESSSQKLESIFIATALVVFFSCSGRLQLLPPRLWCSAPKKSTIHEMVWIASPAPPWDSPATRRRRMLLGGGLHGGEWKKRRQYPRCDTAVCWVCFVSDPTRTKGGKQRQERRQQRVVTSNSGNSSHSNHSSRRDQRD